VNQSQPVFRLLADERRLQPVIDAIFTLVGLFSLDGVVVDVNEAPLTASTLRRDQVVGHRFVDLPWFAHSASERTRIAEAIAGAAHGQTVRLETWIRSARDGASMCIDASFTPLRDQAGAITHVIGSGVDITSRKHAELELTASRGRLAEAQRVAHIGSWQWSVADNRVTWTDELFNIYGLDRNTFVASYEGFLSRVHADDVDHTTTVIREALQRVTPFVYDHRIVRPDGAVRMLHTRGEAVPGADGKAERLIGTCWDVTERWHATVALEHTVSTLTATLEATADGILVGDRKGRVATLNQRFLTLWRLPPDIGPGSDIRALAERVRDQLEDPDGFMARVTELYGDLAIETREILRFKDGRVYERFSTPQRMGGSICGRVCSFRDVTSEVDAQQELRASNEQLRALALRLDAVREEERRVIAREIHDQIGQALTALKLDVDWLRHNLTGGAAMDERARATDALIDQTIDTARRLATMLRPAILDDVGLAAAIAWQGRDFQQRTGVACTVDAPDGGPALAPPIALCLFRIVQEAMTNVARHAQAKQLRISLRADDSGVVLTVADDGRGVTAEELERPTSLGIIGIRERALAVGGSVSFSGHPGRGTTLTVRVPIVASRAA
jgi:PAS domain S-box-containing protein